MMAGLVASLVGGFVSTWAVRAAARRLRFLNHPNPLVPQHESAVAYGGGLGVLAGIVAGVSVAPADTAILAPAALAVVLGTIDDVFPLTPLAKIAGQLGVAAALVYVGPVPEITGIPTIDVACTAVAAVVLMNAVNLTDVCDGLASGLGIIALSSFAVATGSAVLGLAAASLTGFLAFNRPPASIFLGDSGSHLIGLLLAAGWAVATTDRGPLPGVTAAALACAVFLFELGFLVVVRRRKRVPFWLGSPDHFSLRLQAGPLTRWQTVILSWGLGAVTAGAAIIAYDGPDWIGLALLLAVFLAAIPAARVLLRWDVH